MEFTWVGAREGRRADRSMSGVRALCLVLALAAGAALAGASAAETDSPCAPFRVEWNRGVLSPTASKIEGFVYNESACSVSAVRIRVVAVTDRGHPLGETLGWVYGDIPAGERGYFVLALPEPPAAHYRIDVVSFDEVTRRR